MYSITIITVGTLKKLWQDADAEYRKRLRPYAKMNVIEMPEVPFRDSRDAPRVQKHEAEHITRRLPAGAYKIALDMRGKNLTSEQFARALNDQSEGGRQIAFLIGGPLGLSGDLRDSCNLTLSLGSLTLTHQLARIVLLEQLYRAMTIIHQKTYHY